ncbi:serine/threonine-protein kinase pelle [Drosophila sulfurigaster albostrigata]|uniref:serine/threonine-protein kinase pelle n=1 Tax=Drosophila sulfurigaster albostrigata TaxID=89887 RepID=UPI002D219C65|nr:serine/threonine-protein kinase pelle [Drosophila sulfurigaster albostrigata]
MSAAGAASSKREVDNPLPIALLPVCVRQELCEHLDALDVWKQLATFVKLYPQDVNYIQKQLLRGQSPTNEFLNIWGGQYNQNMHSLFALFHNNKLRSAMLIIKDYVDVKLHKYIAKTVDRVPNTQEVPNTRSNNNASESGAIDAPHNRNNNLESSDDIRVSSVQRAAESLLQIDYAELVAATDNWNPENKLGNGGFGEVYKGEIMNSFMAIKVMNYVHKHSNKTKVHLQQSYNELKYLNTLRHDNILAIYAYSINGEKPCLVYELMAGGSLDSRLRAQHTKPRRAPLTWQQRLLIALGTAKGIYFLHKARVIPLIHGDIKPANILLDDKEKPKIGDFGLAREGPKFINDVTKVNKVFGTRIYLPPEFLSSKELSTGVDIYSFGVVLLEMFTGRLMAECTHQADQQLLLKSIKKTCHPSENPTRSDIFDKNLVTPMGEELDKCLCAIDFGLKCTAFNVQQRPSMAEVVTHFKAFD